MAKNYKVYDDLGVQFIYPNNWFVQTETWDKGTYGVTVDSPEGSFWGLAIYPKGVDLDAAAKKIVEEMHAEYDEIDESRVIRYVADRVLTGYEINFFYLDLASTAIALKFQDERRGYVVFWQTCDRLSISEGEEEETFTRSDVFEVMTHTFVSNLTGQDADWDEEDDEARFNSKDDEKAQREEENREYFRRKYQQARLSEEEKKWRAQVDEFESDDENDEERRRAMIAEDDQKLEDFLRDAEKEYDVRYDETVEDEEQYDDEEEPERDQED